VKIKSLKAEGTITAILGDEVEVLVGNLRARVKASDLAPSGEAESLPPTTVRSTSLPAATERSAPAVFRPSPGMELDLRGQRAEDALDLLDRYIENAYMSGMPFVRIIHGKGTGRLRQVIREALKASSQVKGFEEGGDKEGGEGVTIAHLSDE
jgi:DNA mismatch repair protein MutS2